MLAGGAGAGQAIIIAASPVLTRLYTPENFGVLAVFASLLGILAVIASLRYELAIPLPENEEEAAGVTVLSLLVVIGMVAVTALLVAYFGGSAAAAINMTELKPYLWLLPIGLLLTGTYQVLNNWAIRVNAFPTLARTKLIQALSTVGVQLGAYTLGPLALLLGQLIGRAGGTTSLGSLALSRDWTTFRRVRFTDIRGAAARYRRFPIYSSWSGMFNKTGTELPPILFATLFSPAIGGIYMLAQRVLAKPMQLLGRAIADVFFSSASEAYRRGGLGTLVSGVHGKLAHIALPPVALLVMLAPDLFAFTFGAPWRQAGEFAQWMAPLLYIQFVTSPLGRLHSVLEKQAQGVLFHAILLLVRLSSLTIGTFQQDVMLAVALFSIGSACCWAGFLLWILYLSGLQPIRVALSSTAKAAVFALLIVVPIIFALAVSDSVWVLCLAMIVSGTLLAARYYSLLRAMY